MKNQVSNSEFDIVNKLQPNFEEKLEKLKTCGFKARKYFREYCDNTSIHGFKYLGEKRSRPEKVWWFICIVICMTTCAYMTSQMFRKWQKSPVFVSFATKQTPIYEIPFPAVTICPQARFANNLFNFTDLYRKKVENDGLLTKKERENFELLSLICHVYPHLNYTNDEFLEDPQKFYEVLNNVSTNFLKSSLCRWMTKYYDCSDILYPIVTDVGLCYTFNMLDRDELLREDVVHYGNFLKIPSSSENWTLEDGYKNKEEINVYPRRAILSGANNAFLMQIHTKKADLDYICASSLQGFKVLLHTPGKIPQMRRDYFMLPLDQAVVVSVQPDMMTTSEPVKAYPPSKRECYFSSERYLKYFKVYNQENCEMECLTNYTLHYCDCVNYFMPHDNDTDICGVGSKKCMQEAERQLTMKSLAKSLNATYQQLKRKNNKIRKRFDCNCLPLCTDLNYNMELSQNEWDWYQHYNILKDPQAGAFKEIMYVSKLLIYFKNSQFITSQRNELYGWKDFLANFGGFLGLFSGFSILSLVEIVYFASVRILINIKMYGRSNWAGSD